MQSGFEFNFEFDNKNGQTVLSLSVSKLADIPITIHREVPDGVTVKEVSIKKERTGGWYASFAVEGKGEPAKLENPDRCVGIDVGILKYTHDTDGRAVGSLDLDLDLDLQNERERLTREQRSLCSPPQTVLTLWMYSASLKQEAEAEAPPSPEPRQRLSGVG